MGNLGVDCEWSSWLTWSPCSAVCGDGTKWRKRQINAEAEYGGESCTGNKKEEKICNAKECQGGNFFSILGSL